MTDSFPSQHASNTPQLVAMPGDTYGKTVPHIISHVEKGDDSSERLHARLGGSSAHRWLNCPGSVALCESLPEAEISHAALLGTYAHELCEKRLKTFLNHKITGESVSEFPADNTDFDPSELERADIAADIYVRLVWEKVLNSSLTGKAYGFEDLFYVNKEASQWGYVDFWAIYINSRVKRTGVVVDFKNGFYKVDVENNAQLAFYAVALRNFVRESGKDLDCVRTVIIQPNLSDAENYFESTLTTARLNSWEKKFKHAAELIFSSSKKSRLTKPGVWCMFCAGKAVCKSYSDSLSAAAGFDVVKAQSALLPSPDTLSDEALRNIITHGKAVEDFIAACRSYALSRMRGDSPVSGLKIVTSSTRRCWRKDEENIAEALSLMGIANPWTRKLIGITAAEKIIGKNRLNDLCTTTAASEIVVPESDARPALTGLSPDEMFPVT